MTDEEFKAQQAERDRSTLRTFENLICCAIGYRTPRTGGRKVVDVIDETEHQVWGSLACVAEAYGDAVQVLVKSGMDEAEASDLCRKRLRSALVTVMTGSAMS